MVQLPLGPAYALVSHKVQALTMRGKVLGCLEGIFAHGQVYVLISRVTDPQNLCLIGLPPADLLDEVAEAWAANGLDVDACFATAAAVTGDREYTPAGDPRAATRNARSRLTKKETEERRVPVRLRSLDEILDPQPQTAEVLHRLLDWIDRADRAARAGKPKPAFTTAEKEPIFPEDDEEWWLTEFERRKKKTAVEEPSSSDPETESEKAAEGEEEEEEETDDDEIETDEEHRPDAGTDTEDDRPGGPTNTELEPRRPQSAATARTGAARSPEASSEVGSASRGPAAAGVYGSGAGLDNLGNTCYINAVVQATVACGETSRRVAEETQPQATEIRQRTQELFRAMRRAGGAGAALPGTRRTSLSPREFWRAVRSACPAFDNTRQHDAPDFFISLRREIARLPGEVESSPAWAAWLAEPDMHVTKYTTCAAATCPYSNTDNLPAAAQPPRAPEPVVMTELEAGARDAAVMEATTDNLRAAAGQPPRAPEPVVMTELEAGARYASVMEALAGWTGPGRVDDWQCPGCRRFGGTTVTRCRKLPPVLVIWLKRFRKKAGAAGRRIDAPVHRLEDDLDFTAHLDASADAARGGPTTTANGTRYRTRAIVCHHGASLTDGHYTCWVRATAAPAGPAEDAWVQYNDSTVGRPRTALPPTVATDAYLLFYEQIRPSPPENPQPARQVIEIDGTAGQGDVPGTDAAGPETFDLAGEEAGDVEMREEDDSDGEDAMDTT